MSDSIRDLDENSLAKELVGKSIASIEENKITLSDGTVLIVVDTADCCAWFNGEIEAFDFKDNIVTAVEWGSWEGNGSSHDSWCLRVLSSHTLLAQVNIEGDPTSGYYCHSVNLYIERPALDGDRS